MRYSYKWQFIMGNPDARQDSTFRYEMPFDSEETFCVLQGQGGTFSHKGWEYYAYDFAMPEGTTVLAARAGEVVRIEQNYTTGGVDFSFKGKANLVTVRHSDGTFGDYLHLKFHGVLVHPGDLVEAGDPIGLSGNTGFSSQPHLHFHVWRANAEEETNAQTLPIRFDDGTEEGFIPKQGDGCN